ncbi:hypothetical protein PENSPDRAFT_117808 [Peniophora sp. CONT]|nr:hypothetical protein PENSPDRAFT_117808 [Peniophora sp. CONT]
MKEVCVLTCVLGTQRSFVLCFASCVCISAVARLYFVSLDYALALASLSWFALTSFHVASFTPPLNIPAISLSGSDICTSSMHNQTRSSLLDIGIHTQPQHEDTMAGVCANCKGNVGRDMPKPCVDL